MALIRNWLSLPFTFPKTNSALQVVRWSGSRAAITSVTESSARVALPAGSALIELSTTENCYIAFGDVTVTASSTIGATSRLFLAGVQVIPVPLDANGDPYTYIAAVQVSAAGILQVERVT